MDIKSELRKVRDSHKAEEQRLRQLAEEMLKDAEMHASLVQTYDVAIADPMLDSGEQLTLGLPDNIGSATKSRVKRRGKKRAPKGPTSLIDCARAVIAVREGEFESRDLLGPIEELAPGLLASLQPKALTKILWRLATLGEIELVREGGGGKAAVYRVPN